LGFCFEKLWELRFKEVSDLTHLTSEHKEQLKVTKMQLRRLLKAGKEAKLAETAFSNAVEAVAVCEGAYFASTTSSRRLVFAHVLIDGRGCLVGKGNQGFYVDVFKDAVSDLLREAGAGAERVSVHLHHVFVFDFEFGRGWWMCTILCVRAGVVNPASTPLHSPTPPPA
jgi:hypothetical protein